MKKLLLTFCCLMAAAASAQVAVTVIPTTGTGADDSDVGATSASVQQNVNLILPQRTALHLDVTELNFDLTELGQNGVGESGSDMACVYGEQDKDVTMGLGANFWNQTQVLPNGVAYGFDETPPDGDWAASKPRITLKNAKGLATSYPPIKIENGKLVAGSKNNFVCFKTFIIQKFSNVGNFKLTVTRDKPEVGARGNHKMYIQDNSCFTINKGMATGLYALPVGSTRELLPMDATKGTTGAQADGSQPGGSTDKRCNQDHKSWLDDLVVIAVKINGDLAGTNTAALTYTLESKASAFEVGDRDTAGTASY